MMCGSFLQNQFCAASYLVLRTIAVLLLLLGGSTRDSVAQGVLPVHRYRIRPFPLDLTRTAPSFAYGLRRLRSGYTGAAVRIRRTSDNAEADLGFDSNGGITATTIVTIVAPGSSSLSIGTKMSLTGFRASAQMHVVIWYDQGRRAYHASNPSPSGQPVFSLDTASSSVGLPIISFGGATHLNVGQPLSNLIPDAVSASLMLVAKPTGTGTESFGMQYVTLLNITVWRWAVIMNVPDQTLRFDAADYNLLSTNQHSIPNGANLGVRRQYSFLRGQSTKAIRINNAPTTMTLTNVANSGTPWLLSGERQFKIGSISGDGSGGFLGNTSEIILFPQNLDGTDLGLIELNQKRYWRL